MKDTCKNIERCRMEDLTYWLQPEIDDQGEIVGGRIELWPLFRWFKDFHHAFALGWAEAEWLCYKRPDGVKGWKFRVFYVSNDYQEDIPSLTVDFPSGFDVHDVTVTDDNTGKMYKLVPVNGQVADGIDNHWYKSGFETGQREMANYLHSRATEHMRKE